MKIIQIGANNGKDHVYDFINQNLPNLELAVLVEPIPFIINELKNQYKDIKNAYIENIAISNEDNTDSMKLYYLKDSNYEVSSFNYYHTKTHSPSLIDYPVLSLDVPCLSINKLMDKYDLTYLDYLFIDTEGLDVHIISSIDFLKYDIQNIIFESAHTDGPFNAGENLKVITAYLNQYGYNVEQYDSLSSKASKIN